MSIKILANALPKKLKIGPYPWTIKFADGWAKYEDSNKWGLCDHGTATITISSPETMPSKEMLIGVVIHEVLHAIWTIAGLPVKAKEEEAVAGMEVGLLQLVKDNPSFIAWIMKGLK